MSKPYFLPEWVTGIFYGGQWHDVQEGTFRTGIKTAYGTSVIYIEDFTKEVVFLREEITGYKIKQREFKPVVVPEYPDILDD